METHHAVPPTQPVSGVVGQGAVAVIEALVAGRNPLLGVPLPPEHLCLEPAVNAALWCALGALDDVALRQERRARLPDKVGKPWTPAEDAELVRAFDAGEALAIIAARLARTRAGVRARLERHGRSAPRGTP
jgi:hypothetical protein